MKSLSDTAKAILVKESDDPTPDRDAKLTTPNKATLRPGAKAVEGRFANPGANSPGEGEYEDLGPAAVNPTDVPPSAKAAGGVKKDASKSAQAAVPAEKGGSMMEEDVEISEELEAFINQMMEEGYSEEEISEAIAENFEIVEAKKDDDKEDDDDDDDKEEVDEELEAFVEEMMEEGFTEEEIAEALEEALAEEHNGLSDEHKAKVTKILKGIHGEGKVSFEVNDGEHSATHSDGVSEYKHAVYPDGKSVKVHKSPYFTNDEIDEESLNELNVDTVRKASYVAKGRAEKAWEKAFKNGQPEKDNPDFVYAKKKAQQGLRLQAAADKKAAMKEHVDALLAGENLSEDFRAKAETLFESAVSLRVNEEVAVLEQAYEQALEEEVSTIMDTLSEQVDGYLGYVVENWMKENEIAIEHGLRTEITEEFISGLKTLFAENYIDIPTEKVDITEELGSKVAELQAQLNEEINKGIELRSALVESKKFEAFAMACDGLTATEAEKLRTLAEGIEASSVDEYETKLGVIKESYFTEDAPAKKSAPLDLVEDRGSGSDEPLVESMNRPMAAYVKTLDRSLVKKTQ